MKLWKKTATLDWLLKSNAGQGTTLLIGFDELAAKGWPKSAGVWSQKPKPNGKLCTGFAAAKSLGYTPTVIHHLKAVKFTPIEAGDTAPAVIKPKPSALQIATAVATGLAAFLAGAEAWVATPLTAAEKAQFAPGVRVRVSAPRCAEYAGWILPEELAAGGTVTAQTPDRIRVDIGGVLLLADPLDLEVLP